MYSGHFYEVRRVLQENEIQENKDQDESREITYEGCIFAQENEIQENKDQDLAVSSIPWKISLEKVGK